MAISMREDSSPKLSSTLGDDSLDALIEASIEDVAKSVFYDEVDFEALTLEELERSGLTPDSDIEVVSDYVNDAFYDDEEVPDEEISLSHVELELPQPQRLEKPSLEHYPPSVELTELGRVFWNGKVTPTNDPDLYEEVRSYIENYASDPDGNPILKRMMSGTKSLTEFSKQFLNVLNERFERQGIDAEYLALKSGKAIPGVDPFDSKSGIYTLANLPDISKCVDAKEYNRQCEALRLSAEYPGLFRKATGLFVLDAAKRIVQTISEKQALNVNDISYRQVMGAVHRAAESAISIAKREIKTNLAVSRKREIEEKVRTAQDLKVVIQKAKEAVDQNEVRSIDLFGRKFRLRRNETSTQAAARARKEYRESVSDRIGKLEKQGLLPVLAAAVAQGRGAGAVTSADVTRAQSLIKTAKTSYGAFQSPKALIEQALGGAEAARAIQQQTGKDPVRGMLASLKADTRRNELLSGLQTFGRTLSRLQDKSASIKASHKAQAAQFAADALLKAGFEPPSVNAIRAALKGQGWSLADAKQQNVRLRGLEKGIVNALGDPAPQMKQPAREIKQAVIAAGTTTQILDANGQQISVGDALRQYIRRQRQQRKPRDNESEDDGSPKR